MRLLVLGGGGWSARACAGVARFAERFALPVATSFRRAALFSADHPNYAGEIGIGPNPALKARAAEADLLILAGGRMAEMPSQSYTLLSIPVPRQTLVHVHPDPAELGRVYAPALGIMASPDSFAAALEALQPPQTIPWAGAAEEAHASYRAWTEGPPAAKGKVDMAEVVRRLRAHLPDEAVVTNGAGNYAIWVGRYFGFRRFGTQLAPTSGSMGFGVPAAVAAKRLDPARPVVAFAGDGCFLMNGQEFATAVQYRLAIVVVVVDNGMYGTIRMHQEREHPGRVSGTDLQNPDFAAYARAFGGHGETVAATEDFMPAFHRAEAAGVPAIIHVKTDPDVITPATTLTAMRAR